MQVLASMLSLLASKEGFNSTPLPGVGVYKSSASRPREPLCYNQGIIIVAQGSKNFYLESKTFSYNPNQFLALALPVPAECETFASIEKPFLGMVVDIDNSVLHELVRVFDEHQCIPEEFRGLTENKSLFVSEVSAQLSDVALRLAKCLLSPLQAKALGDSLVKELLFTVLTSEQAGPLFALAMHNTNLSRLERALRHIHLNYQESLDVDQLASLANMSTSTFHRNFREITSSSPIQYLKKLRLSKARELLVDKGLKVKQAAAQVGYESPTQFSREFKRHFGMSPQVCGQQLAH